MPCTHTFKGPPAEMQLLITLHCHQDATHVIKAHRTSLAGTVTFYHLLPDGWPWAQLIMVFPGFIPLRGTSSGFVLPNTTTSAWPSWGQPKTPPETKQAFHFRNTYLDMHLKNLYSSSLLSKPFTDNKNKKERSKLMVWFLPATKLQNSI